jgi:hypothetical protein
MMMMEEEEEEEEKKKKGCKTETRSICNRIIIIMIIQICREIQGNIFQCFR